MPSKFRATLSYASVFLMSAFGIIISQKVLDKANIYATINKIMAAIRPNGQLTDSLYVGIFFGMSLFAWCVFLFLARQIAKFDFKKQASSVNYLIGWLILVFLTAMSLNFAYRLSWGTYTEWQILVWR